MEPKLPFWGREQSADGSTVTYWRDGGVTRSLEPKYPEPIFSHWVEQFQRDHPAIETTSGKMVLIACAICERDSTATYRPEGWHGPFFCDYCRLMSTARRTKERP